ncbi:uncharacterized protein [Chiloscyllium punctatum]|uniref:uncharacterized protein n=1 Tax=Chiloscyllium punctatum TaxID=137246 RepID=UPI003B636A34
MPVQDPTPTTCVSTNQVQHKRSAETTNSEISSKRRLKERLLHTPATGCTGLINGRPVSKRISTGHFSAWGVEDDEVLYYMQKDSQSADPVSVPTSYHEEMSTQTQRLTYICKVESNRTKTPQITSSVAEMFTCSPSFTTSSQMTDAMCFVTQTAPSRDSSDGSPDEILPTGTASRNIPSPTGINPSTCLLPVSPGTGLDETVPSGSWKLSDNVEEHRDSQVQGSWSQWESAEEYKDSQVQDKTEATMSYWIQDPPISIIFPRIFDPPVYATSDSAVLSMINMPPSSRSDMNTTVVSTTPFQAPPFLVGCSNETGNNNFNSGMDGSSLNFLPVFGQACNTEVANAYITENPSPYQSTEAGFHFPSNLVPNCTFGRPTNNVFQFGANNTNQSTFQESFSFAPNSSTWKGLSNQLANTRTIAVVMGNTKRPPTQQATLLPALL